MIKIASKRIDIQIDGKDSTSKAFNSASKNVSKLGSDMSKTGQTIGSSLSKGTATGISSLNKLGSIGATIGGKIGTGISKGAQTASNAISKMGTTASQTFSKISSGASKASQSMDSVSSAIAGIAGGYGIMQVAQDAWTGATQREFNQAYLGTKMSTAQAEQYVSQINQIASVVPGDDTFLNQVLTGALAKQTNLSYQEMMNLGTGLADYMSVSQAMGKSQIETQMDLKEYISTGNTTQLERDSILKNQLSTLEDQATVSDRITALNQALADEGYKGLSGLDIASIKWQNTLGQIQLAITNIGSALLVFIEPALDFFLKLNEQTGGLSTTIGVVLGVIGLLGVSIIGFLPVITTITGAVVELAVGWGLVAEGATFFGAAGALALGPVGLIILGITAAIIAGIVIWTIWGDKIKETFGFLQSGNWGGVAANIGAAFTYIKDAVINAISQIPSAIGSISGTLVQLGYQMVHWIVDGLTNLSGYLDIILGSINLTDAGGNAGNTFSDGFSKWIDDNGPVLQKSFVVLFTKLIPLLGQVAFKLSAVIGMYLLKGLIALGGKILWILAQPWIKAGNYIKGAWNNTMNFFRLKAQEAVQWVVTRWNWLKAVWNTVTAPIVSAWQWAMGSIQWWANYVINWVITRWNALKALVSIPIEGAVKIVSDTIDWAKQKYQDLKDFIYNNPITQTVKVVYNYVTGNGPAGPRGPRTSGSIATSRGPYDGLNLNYEGYGGAQKNPWNGPNSMSGKCVDMSLGLMAMSGGAGSIIQGTWNGGPHVWYRDPSGRDWDPARKALNNTWSPPARGPSGVGPNITINGDVYGYDDFQRKVEKGMDRYMGKIM